MNGLVFQKLEKIRGAFAKTEENLQKRKPVYEMAGFLYVLYGRIHPDGSKTCHPYRNTNLRRRLCTSDSRVAEFFAILRRSDLWPISKPFFTCILVEILSRFEYAQNYRAHQCTAKSEYLFKRELILLFDRVQRLVKYTKGIPMGKAT